MSDKTTINREGLTEKECKLLDFCIEFKDDPDFNRLPVPDKILERMGIKREHRQISAMEATKYAFSATSINSHQYRGHIEVIDQSASVSQFPNLVALADSINTSETKIQQLEDSSSLPSPDDEKCIVASEQGLDAS